MKKITLLSLILGMSLSLLFANSWYYDLGGGYVINQTFHASQRIGYQITTEPSLYLTIETAFEGEHEKEVWVKRYSRHQSFFLAPGIMYYPMPRWQVSVSTGIEHAVAIGNLCCCLGGNKREPSFALKLSTAYDLSRTGYDVSQTGHGFQVGLQYFWANCGSVQSATLGMFLKYRYKGSNDKRERRERVRQERPVRETIIHW